MIDIDALDINIKDEVPAYHERLDQRCKSGATFAEADRAEAAEFARWLAQAAAHWQWIAESPRFFRSVYYEYTDVDDLVAHLSDEELNEVLGQQHFLHGEVARLWDLFRRALAIWRAGLGDALPEYGQPNVDTALERQHPN